MNPRDAILNGLVATFISECHLFVWINETKVYPQLSLRQFNVALGNLRAEGLVVPELGRTADCIECRVDHHSVRHDGVCLSDAGYAAANAARERYDARNPSE